MTKSRRKSLQILSEPEIEEIFALPKFTDTERIYYFTLSPNELVIMSNLIYGHSKALFILQLGYFKAKFRLFSFNTTEVAVDLAYIMNRYFPKEPTPNQLPSKTMIAANNNRILELMNYKKSHMKLLFKKTWIQIAVAMLVSMAFSNLYFLLQILTTPQT